MLTNLHVKNFALIDEADIALSEHFNVLTGETGAGKSILLGAVNLALGARMGKDVIKTGADSCLAELTFTGLSAGARAKAEELGIDIGDDQLVISRKLTTAGKSLARVNGETFSSAQIRELTSELIDIYGQNEHQSLSDPAKQLAIIDRYLKDELAPIKGRLAEAYDVYSGIRHEREGLDRDPASRQRRMDLLRFQMQEIDNAALTDNEEEELREEHKKLANTHIIAEHLSEVRELLEGSEGCSDRFSSALKSLGRISEFDGSLEGMYNSLADLDSCLAELSNELRDYFDELPDSDERLQQVEERLDLIARLKSKYGRSTAEIGEFYRNCSDELDKLEQYESYCSELEDRFKAAEAKVDKLSCELSDKRRSGSALLQERIVAAMSELNFNRVVFEIAFDRKEDYGRDGRDEVEFMISLNPGESVRPLAKVASGGELSRIMLAIKSVMAVQDDIGTLIFDEIDTGISGRTAQKVGDRLAAISGVHQVICITHLPQIAAMADSQLLIEKFSDDSSTRVGITPLDEAGMLLELVRLIGGDTGGSAIAESAAELKHSADERKKAVRSRSL